MTWSIIVYLDHMVVAPVLYQDSLETNKVPEAHVETPISSKEKSKIPMQTSDQKTWECWTQARRCGVEA